MAKQLSVEVWSDTACPWCYVGKRRLEQALASFPHADRVRVRYRAFQLDPSAPRVDDGSLSHAERLARKYGTTPVQAQAMTDRLVNVAASDGIGMRFDIIRSGNTFDAHRLLALAHARGLGAQLKERLLRAYFCEGARLGMHEDLLRLAVEVGLEADEVQGVLAGDLFSAEVRADLEQARRYGISGVPFFVLGRYGVSGAQPAELLREALHKAWDEASDELPEAETGVACDAEGCS
ncbi:MAG: DsbA family oxidoreductase [Myxococcales bacterium]